MEGIDETSGVIRGDSLPVEFTYESGALGRTNHFSCFMPAQKSADDSPLPVLLMLHGYGSNRHGWYSHTRMLRTVSDYAVAVVFAQGDNGWYTNSADGLQRYEDDVMHDLIPAVCSRLPVVKPGPRWAIEGMSMGGYGAIKMALKFPETFGVAVSHSGALEKPITESEHPVFGNPDLHAEYRQRENLIWLLEQLMCRFPVYRPRLFLDCGLNDPLLEENRRFSNHLNFLGYHHHYRETAGHHTWPYWNRAFRTQFPDTALEIGAARLLDHEPDTVGVCSGLSVKE